MSKSPLKVLYLLHDSRRSGVPAVAANAVRVLQGLIKPLLLFAYDGVYAEELKREGLHVEVFAPRYPLLWRLNRFLFLWRLFQLRRSVDVVHIHSLKLTHAVLFASLLGCRVVFHIHELPGRTGPLLRLAIRVADRVVFCSHTCARHFGRYLPDHHRTIVNAMAFPDIPPVMHVGRGGRVIMAASLNRNKGQDLLLEAFARMGRDDSELLLYGTVGLSARGYVKALKQRVMELGLEKRVHFPGPTADVLTVFRSAAVVVHTSWTESFGMALVEAMACGIPVLAHDLEGMQEVVQDGETGYLVPPGDVVTLAVRLEQLLADPDLRNRLGGQAWCSVRLRFAVADRVPEYLALYQELCQS
jgi:glycosyltransferase involved in cell wall biosynthesis